MIGLQLRLDRYGLLHIVTQASGYAGFCATTSPMSTLNACLCQIWERAMHTLMTHIHSLLACCMCDNRCLTDADVVLVGR